MLETYDTREAWADAAAEAIADTLAAPGAGPFVATGGTTPGPCYDRLAKMDLPWRRIAVTLTDERFVDPSSDESNEKLVRQRLLVGKAAASRFLPLKGDGPTPEADAAAADERLRGLFPSAAVLLGMGPDGHVASLFPGSKALAAGLDFDTSRLAIAVDKAGLQPLVPRISLTARALTRSGLIVIFISGAEKRGVIERIEREPDFAPPAAAILRQMACPVRVLWAE
ncbi:MAG: 6-phosphogluconolactonase [Caulobacteraceae bacterium]